MSEKRSVKWVPDSFVKKAEGAADVELYSGHLLLQVPDSEFKCDLLVELGIADGEEAAKKLGAKALMEIYKKSKHLILSAEVVRVKDAAKLNLDDVLHEEGLAFLPIQFGARMLEGFGPGNG